MISFNLKGSKADTRPKKEQRPEESHGSLFEIEKETSNVKQVSEFVAGELPEKERLKLEEETRLREEKAKTKKIIYLEEKNWRQDLVERREADLAQEEENPPKTKRERSGSLSTGFLYLLLEVVRFRNNGNCRHCGRISMHFQIWRR